MVLQVFFYPPKVAFFAQLKRFKNPLVESSGSISDQAPHIVIGHTSVWHTYLKITMEEAV